MPTTANYALRYPDPAEVANVPEDMENLADDTDAALLAHAAAATLAHPDSSVTDAKIGTRTPDDTTVPASGAQTPTNLWSMLAYMVKAITGKANWRTVPAITLEALSALFDAATGHAHDGAGKGKPITTAGIANLAVTAAKIAAEAWTAFTPTANQGVALTLSTAEGFWIQMGKFIFVHIQLAINSAGTAGYNVEVASLPATIHAHTVIVGHGMYYDQNPDVRYTVEALRLSGSMVTLTSNNTAASFGASPAVTAAAGDGLYLTLIYEAA